MATKNSNDSDSNSHNLVTAPIQASLIRMTIPMILGMIMMFSFNLVDSFFIGLLGTEPLAALTFILPVSFTIMSLAIGLGIGASAVVAKYLGRGEYEKASQASSVICYVAALLASSIVGVCWWFMEPLFMLIGASDSHMPFIRDYMGIWFPGSLLLVTIMTANSVLRARGDTKTPSLLMAAAGLLNAILDPLLIFGIGPFPEMGIKGAALATVIAWGIGFVYLAYLLIIKRQLISPRIPPRKVLFSSSREMLRIGGPAAVANMATPLAAFFMTGIVASYGDAVTAAYGVGVRLETMATVIVLAMSSTLPPLISQNFGAERMDRVEHAYMLSIRFIMLFQLGVYALLAVLAHPIALLFSQEEAVIQSIKLFIWIMPLGYGLQGVIILTNSSLNALHQPGTALKLSVVRFFLFYVPLAWAGSEIAGLQGFFFGAVLGNLFMAAFSWQAFNRALGRSQKRAEQAATEAS